MASQAAGAAGAGEASSGGELLLPEGYRLERVLARRADGGAVLAALRSGERVVVRLEPPGSGPSQSRAELAVLASVDHPGLARLLDHGVLQDGTRYLVRSWIEGEELGRRSAGRPAEELGRIAARLCAALAHLHARGFVHADLKPGNVIVQGEGDAARPVLTDFGLALQRGEGHGGGTPVFVAPEVLRGAAPGAPADLFALGALLHVGLLAPRIDARRFYGRFPAEDFFAATDTHPRDLPAWARDLVVALLQRDPGRRPSGAEQVGRILAGRLGLPGLFEAGPPRLAWPPLAGREDWSEVWWQAVREASRGGRPLVWVALPAGERAAPLLDALAVRATLAGARVRRLDPAHDAARLADAGALDRWAAAQAGAAPGTLLLACAPRGDPWAERALDALARAVDQRSAAQAGRPALVALGAAEPPAPDLDWRALALPPLERDAVEQALARELAEDDPARLRDLAWLLHGASGGSAAGLQRALAAAADLLVAGEERPRLRPGPLPARLDVRGAQARAPAPAAGDEPARTLLAALALLGGEAELAPTAELAQRDDAELAPLLRACEARGWIALRSAGEGLRLELRERSGEWIDGLLDAAGWAALHARRARQLEELGDAHDDAALHAALADELEAEALAARAAALRARGAPERALALLERLEQGPPRRPLAPRLLAERGLAWCDLRQVPRALEAVEPLRGAAQPRVRALLERVLGAAARARHESAAALEHLERARTLDPDDGGDAFAAQAELLQEERRDRELLELVARATAAGVRRDSRAWSHLRAFEAIARMRLGEGARAAEMLRAQIEEARAGGDAVLEAGLRVNLATVERRAGDPAAALPQLERACGLYARAGNPAGLAQARALLGAALRDQGELARAEPLLAQALAVRERLGDRTGATAVRGMLGLLHADQGRASTALVELDAAAAALRAGGRTKDATLLAARAEELRARVGSARDEHGAQTRGEAERAAEGDPRVLLALARAQALRGDGAAARALAVRARSLASSLRLAAIEAEAASLERRIAGETFAHAAPAPGPEAWAEDERVLALLARAPLDAEALSRSAGELEARGRHDRAARLWIALAARLPEPAAAEDCARRAEALLAELAAGLGPAEAARLRETLLGLPDPWPEDPLTLRLRREGDEEMDVLELLEINHRLVAQEDLATLLGAIVEQALAVSGAQRGFLVLEEKGELAFDTALDSRRGDIEAPEVEVSRSVLAEALQRMAPLRVSNASADPDLGSAPSVVALDLRSILCVPFRVQEGLRGVVYVDHRLREGAFDARAERMLGLLADQAALAILQVRRLEEIRRLNRELRGRVERQRSDLALARRELRLRGLPAPAGGLVGSSEAMRAVRALLERAAPSKLAVLVTGPSGSGKELAARALHELSDRSQGPFVTESCAALPANLIEVELFGARRGAFTGAERDREGLVESAHGGTLFLDEVGELPLELQGKLLRVLETSEVRRLGESQAHKVDFRLVAATNRELAEEVRAGRFRADLYYRLDGLRVELPPLDARLEDIPELVEHYLRMQAPEGEPPRAIAPAVVAQLCRRSWPGNVRELFHELARLCVLSGGALEDPGLVRAADPQLRRAAAQPSAGDGAPRVRPIAELEREAILAALEKAGGDKRKAAELLGISRAKVYQRLKEWGMT